MCVHNWAKLAKAFQWGQVDTYHWDVRTLCCHGVLQMKGRFTLQIPEPLCPTVIRGAFIIKQGVMFSSASRGTMNLSAEGHKDTDSGWTKANDALVPTRSFSSFSSHFLSSIISSFCCRSVSCMIWRSFCHNHWASFLLFGSTRRNSLSYEKHVKGTRSVLLPSSIQRMENYKWSVTRG